jgi:hypothetical protein
MLIRHDVIKLHDGASAASFETFIKDELMPFFSQRYKGPTRISIADIKSQSLLKLSGGRAYLWATEWDGPAEAISGAGFEGARMQKLPQTAAMLKKLRVYGKRARCKIFDELASVKVRTN